MVVGDWPDSGQRMAWGCAWMISNGHFSARYVFTASLTTQAREIFLSRAIRSSVPYTSGEKPIVTRTMARLGAVFFAATRFAFWGFRLAGTVCHHAVQ